MKLFSYFAVQGFSNSYIIGSQDGGDAIVIDPAVFDTNMLELVEKNNYYIKHILLTHAHKAHIRGAQTILKIYDAKIYCRTPEVFGYTCNQISEGTALDLSGIKVEIMEIAGHSSDSVIYKINNMLFTGDSLEAGIVGNTPNTYTKSMLISMLQSKVLTLDPHTLIFPGHGPPSTVAAERKYNALLSTT